MQIFSHIAFHNYNLSGSLGAVEAEIADEVAIMFGLNKTPQPFVVYRYVYSELECVYMYIILCTLNATRIPFIC